MTVNRVTVVSFGYLHCCVLPQADLTLDLRRLLADPAHVPSGRLLDLRGDQDPEVKEFVLATPGAVLLLESTYLLVRHQARFRPVTVAFGCAGGKHRAAAMASMLGAMLDDSEVQVTHLHAHLPRVIRA